MTTDLIGGTLSRQFAQPNVSSIVVDFIKQIKRMYFLKSMFTLLVASLLLAAVRTVAQPVQLHNASWKQTALSPQETQNLAVALQFVNEGIARGNSAVFDACVAKDVQVTTGLKPSGPIDGLAEYKSIFADFAAAWPVFDFIVDEAFATDDKVIIRFQAKAYFKKDYYGIKATNQIVNMKEVHVLTVKDGKITNSIVSGTNFPFEYIMYPVLKEAVIGQLPLYTGK